MKKNMLRGVAAILSVSLSLAFTGCSGSDDSDSDSDSPVVVATGGTLQSHIDSATAGSTVTLNSTMEGTSIVITKALTVDGGNLENISVTVSASVQNGVTLKNFKNATIAVASATPNASIRSLARAVVSSEEEEVTSFKKFGDESFPLFIEGCTIERFEAENNVALYLDSGDKRSEIKELYLKEGVEDFTFVEFDEESTLTANKSKVEKLSIEDDGVKEINLIGGTFDDVAFADNFAGEIDFKYDKEFEDQFAEFDTKDEFFAHEKIDARDIALAKDEIANSEELNVYKFTMPRDTFNAMNGKFNVFFLTTAQKAALEAEYGYGTFLDLVTCATPAYDMSLMGAFTVETDDEGTIANGLHAVYGASELYYDYSNVIYTEEGYAAVGISNIPKAVTLDKYKTYSKEAVIVDVGENEVTVYVNKSAIKKSDLLLCSGYKAANADEDATGSSEGGTKLSDISLADYVPFFAVSAEYVFENSGESHENTIPNHQPITDIMELPSANKQIWYPHYLPYHMDEDNLYPDVSTVEYPDITIKSVKVTVKYYNAALEYQNSETVIRENVNPITDNYEYYFDADFTELVVAANHQFVDWETYYEEKDWTAESTVTIYARPRRNITFVADDFGGMQIERLAQINFGTDYIFTGADAAKYAVWLFTTYDNTTGTYSNAITSPKDIADNSTVYVVGKFVKLISFGEESTQTVTLKDKYDLAELMPLLRDEALGLTGHIYKAAATTGDVYDEEGLFAIAYGTSAYTDAPTVLIDPVYEQVEISEWESTTRLASATSKAFADFYALVQGGQTTYYIRSFSPETGITYPQCTKDYLDTYLAETLFPLTTIEVFTTVPSN